ncbi:MAG TPA: hypothetical protein VGQ13_04630 [Nitrososphaera sp.]|jgi:hypothetical protein|nr:hypothetical protein [Nitrososphaera sp.]
MPEKKNYTLCDDATLEGMKNYFRQEDHDALLRYIKTHSMLRHVDIFEEIDSS